MYLVAPPHKILASPSEVLVFAGRRCHGSHGSDDGEAYRQDERADLGAFVLMQSISEIADQT